MSPLLCSKTPPALLLPPPRQVLYEQRKKAKATAKVQREHKRLSDAKEVRVGCHIAAHDMEMKMAQVRGSCRGLPGVPGVHDAALQGGRPGCGWMMGREGPQLGQGSDAGAHALDRPPPCRCLPLFPIEPRRASSWGSSTTSGWW